MANIKAGVLPAGSVAPVASLASGIHQVEILKIGENNEMVVEYPDGWTRDHQAKDNVELCAKITNNLRARYGIESVKFISAPEIGEGAVYEVEV